MWQQTNVSFTIIFFFYILSPLPRICCCCFEIKLDINTSSVDFINYSTRSMRLLAEDALAEFPTTNKTIQTPCCDRWDGIERNYCANTANLCVVSIVRSGDTLASIVREIEPSCKVGKILIQRDEHSVEKLPQLIYHKLPPDIGSCYILLCDPMLATGGSVITALDLLCSSTYNVNPSNVIFANVISCPEGLRIMASKYPDVTIVTIKVDDCLNENKYIVPGLGDFGDRYYNT